MAKLKTKKIWDKSYALGTGLTPVTVDQSVFPRGAIHGLWVRIVATAITAAGGAVVTDYPKILNSITYGAERPKHKVMSAVNGKIWDKVWTTLNRFATPRTAPTTGSGFDVLYYLPFAWPGTDRHKAYRGKDTCLMNVGADVLPSLDLLLGAYTDLWSTATACTVQLIVEADYDPAPFRGKENPDNPQMSGDQPGRYLEILMDTRSDLAVDKEFLLVSGGPRECIGHVAVEQDNTGAEVSDIFNTGISTPSLYEFKYGDADGQNEGETVPVMDSVAQQRFGIAPQAGYHFKLFARNGHLRNALKLRTAERFTLHVNNVSTVASRQLRTMQINTVDIDPAFYAEMAGRLPPVPSPVA